MVELEVGVEEVVFGSQVFMRRCRDTKHLLLDFQSARVQRVMAELEECVEEVVFGSQAFMRRWGADVRDLLARTPEWRDDFSF